MRPLSEVALDPEESGLGLIVRRRGQPIGFILRPCEPGSRLTADLLGEWIAQELGSRLVEEAIVEELRSPSLPPPPISLTVAICTRDRPAVLARCLDSLQRLPPGNPFDILVVDNAPPDEKTAELVRQNPFVRYTMEPRPGIDFARNRALREAETTWIAYLDDDVVIDQGWLAGLQQALVENPDAAGVTGLVLPWRLETNAEILFEKNGGFRRGFDQRRYGALLPGNKLYPAGAGIFGTGANMAFRRDALDALGGFDEALDTGRPLPGGGDLDIYFRIIEAGHPLIYAPAFLVRHEHRKDESALRHQYYTWGLGLMAYVGKHLRPGGRHRPLFRGLVLWWFRRQLRQVKLCLRGRHVLPCSMVLAELLGGCVGICWEYERSMRRVARIRREHP